VAGEFRSNLHRGGSATRVRLPAEYRKTALAAARVLGLRLAGVDMLESKAGPMIMEVNSSPGLEGIESATCVDIADAVIEYLEREVPVSIGDSAKKRPARATSKRRETI
jgi:ribosomal protein S6--L-glutamate ligase